MQTAAIFDRAGVDPFFPGLMFNGTSRTATENRRDTSNLYSFWTGKNHHDRMRQWILWRNMTHATACSKSPVCIMCQKHHYIHYYDDVLMSWVNG
jgi:hypothetical protein